MSSPLPRHPKKVGLKITQKWWWGRRKVPVGQDLWYMLLGHLPKHAIEPAAWQCTTTSVRIKLSTGQGKQGKHLSRMIGSLLLPTSTGVASRSSSTNIWLAYPDAMFHRDDAPLVTPLIAASAISSVTSSSSCNQGGFESKSGDVVTALSKSSNNTTQSY